VRLGAEHRRERVAAALTHDNYALALSGLIVGKSPVAPVLSIIGGLHVAAEISAIDFGFLAFTADRAALHLLPHAFTQFVQQNPCAKAEIKRADLTYEELAERLKEHGFSENGASIANKLARGTFSATFFLAVLTAIGVTAVALEDL
jgi:uncharacterized protein DUF6471